MKQRHLSSWSEAKDLGWGIELLVVLVFIKEFHCLSYS